MRDKPIACEILTSMEAPGVELPVCIPFNPCQFRAPVTKWGGRYCVHCNGIRHHSPFELRPPGVITCRFETAVTYAKWDFDAKNGGKLDKGGEFDA